MSSLIRKSQHTAPGVCFSGRWAWSATQMIIEVVMKYIYECLIIFQCWTSSVFFAFRYCEPEAWQSIIDSLLYWKLCTARHSEYLRRIQYNKLYYGSFDFVTLRSGWRNQWMYIVIHINIRILFFYNVDYMSLICPICQQDLTLLHNSYVCENKHSFDRSSEWYVNLLIWNKKVSWDEPMMIQARRNFLEWGWYEPLIALVARSIEASFPKMPLTIFDVWCGEWWYMRRLQDMRNNNEDRWYGLDIAKHAVKLAARKTTGTFIVGNAYALPLADASCDLILSIFSPYDEKELSRCLKPWGIALVVWPWPEHLYKFIELIRDHPHQHIIKSAEEKFTLLQVQEVKQIQIPMSLTSPAIQDLFLMTPYYRQAPKEKQDAILQLEALTLTADFRIEVVKKV